MSLTSLLSLAPEPIGSRAELFVVGAQTTLALSLLAGTLGLGCGLMLALAKISAWRFLRWPAEFWIALLRGTPLLVQILFAYYALPMLLPVLRLDEFSAAALALTLNIGAYNAEVFRAGIEAVPRGQWEAARSLGLGAGLTFSRIIFPQALRIVIPPLVNNFVALLKDSSLASVIGLLELTLAGNRVSSETFLPVPVLTTVALIYLVLTTAITAVAWVLEKRFHRQIGVR